MSDKTNVNVLELLQRKNTIIGELYGRVRDLEDLLRVVSQRVKELEGKE